MTNIILDIQHRAGCCIICNNHADGHIENWEGIQIPVCSKCIRREAKDLEEQAKSLAEPETNDDQ